MRNADFQGFLCRDLEVNGIDAAGVQIIVALKMMQLVNVIGHNETYDSVSAFALASEQATSCLDPGFVFIGTVHRNPNRRSSS